MSTTGSDVYHSGATTPTTDDHILRVLASLFNESASLVEALFFDEGVASPIVIRWDIYKEVKKLVLPTADISTIQGLVGSTQPAGFDFQGKDVIDEPYKKASKLDPSAFSTNFCPYEVGTIDTMSRTLLPLPKCRAQGIRAELYKLNVYEGPSGMFKPHLDTSRSDLHFGSLVVCLPSAHEGGQLIVRHQHHSSTFDWSEDSSNLQWVAFYGDCEHEMSQVTSGYCTTLTYNLFIRHGVGQMTVANTSLDVAKLPVYKEVQAALADPLFFPDGGILGNYCSHAYAHATRQGILALPAALKGLDMVTYETFESLGMEVQLQPELDINSQFEPDYYSDDDEVTYLRSNHIGKQLTQYIGSDAGGHDNYGLQELFADFPHDIPEVKWLNVPVEHTENLQYGYLAYGNQTSIAWAYSFCVLFMNIPPHAERMKMIEHSEPAPESPDFI